MPQMKPMLWIIVMMMTLSMIMTTIIITFFMEMKIMNDRSKAKMKAMKWKW